MNVKKTIETILRDSLILVFNQDKLDVVGTARALMRAGVSNMEVTCRISRPLEKIKQLKNEIPEFVIGAASLVDFEGMLGVYNNANPADTLPSVAEVVEAGVDYIVSAANFSDETYRKFKGKVGIIPGCGTTTEVVSQYSKGANLCKVFPAKQLGGPGFVKAIDPAIHKMISMVPTGGTNASNIADYIDAGVMAVGGSFSMIEKETMKKIVDGQDYELLTEEIIKIKQMIDGLRAKKWPNIDFSVATIEQVSEVTGRNFNL